MLALTIDELSKWVGYYLWPFFRVAAFLQVAPIIGTQVVSARVRLIIAVSISLVIAPTLPPAPMFDGITLNATLITIQQVLIGIGMGIFLQLLFQIFIVGGQMIAMQTGMGMSQMVDPASGISVAVTGQFYLIMTTLIYLSLNGHVIMIEILAESFRAIPVGETGFPTNNVWMLVSGLSWMFEAALMLSLPAVTAILIINMTFGIITKAAPQLNIFSIGFPATLLLGLGVMWISLAAFLPIYDNYFYLMFSKLRELLGLG